MTMTFTSFKLVNRMTLDPHWPLILLTSRHLFHDDLEVAVLAERAQVFDDVSVTESTVQLDFFMKRLHFPNFENWANSMVRHVQVKVKEWRHCTMYLSPLWKHYEVISPYCVFFSGISLTAILTCVLVSRAAYTVPNVPRPNTTRWFFSSSSYWY